MSLFGSDEETTKTENPKKKGWSLGWKDGLAIVGVLAIGYVVFKWVVWPNLKLRSIEKKNGETTGIAGTYTNGEDTSAKQ